MKLKNSFNSYLVGEVMKTKIEIVTGFLGSGKTAFLNALIKETIVKDESVLVIQLEDGETKINKIFGNINIRNYYGDIEEFDKFLLKNLREGNYFKVFIEYNGTETIEKLANILNKDKIKKLCKISTIYFIADVNNIKSYVINMGDFIVPAIENSNLILLNNCINSDDKKIEEAINLMEELNLSGHILTCDNNNSIDNALKKSKLFNNRTIKKIYMNLCGDRK